MDRVGQFNFNSAVAPQINADFTGMRERNASTGTWKLIPHANPFLRWWHLLSFASICGFKFQHSPKPTLLIGPIPR
jgi:hypothetical protein